MSLQRHLIMLMAASVAFSSLWAAEPATPPAPAKPEVATDKPTGATAAKPEVNAAAKPDAKGEAKPADGKPADGAQAAAKPAEKGTAAEKAASPQRFIPSEQVRADFDVSFPIDI